MAYRAFRRRVLYPKRAPTPAPRQLGGVGADGLGVIAEGFVELRALADHALDHVGELVRLRRVDHVVRPAESEAEHTRRRAQSRTSPRGSGSGRSG